MKTHSTAIYVTPMKNLMITNMAKFSENAQIVPNTVTDPMPMKKAGYRPILWRIKNSSKKFSGLRDMECVTLGSKSSYFNGIISRETRLNKCLI